MVQGGLEKGRSYCDGDDLIEIWYYNTQEVAYIVNVRYFYSNCGATELVTIQKVLLKENRMKFFGNEPTMHEKNSILNGLNIRMYGSAAFEIFPARDRIVDEKDLFHVWIVNNKKALPFITEGFEVKFLKYDESVEINGEKCYYRVNTIHNFKTKQKQYVYHIWSSSGKELTWREKQSFKDSVIGKEATAIEIIKETKNNVSSLVVLPPRVKIPFGLKPKKSSKNFED